MTARLDAGYLNGVRAALEAVDAVGGAGVLDALSKLGLSIVDLGSPAFLVAAQRRADDFQKSQDEFAADKAADYEARRAI